MLLPIVRGHYLVLTAHLLYFEVVVNTFSIINYETFCFFRNIVFVMHFAIHFFIYMVYTM
jgi:hypothetical protein